VSGPAEPTLADVLSRIDVLALEMRAGFAETRLALAELRSELHELDHSMRDLWNEHLGHSHPDG
jgi:hypothetical protein